MFSQSITTPHPTHAAAHACLVAIKSTPGFQLGYIDEELRVCAFFVADTFVDIPGVVRQAPVNLVFADTPKSAGLPPEFLASLSSVFRADAPQR